MNNETTSVREQQVKLLSGIATAIGSITGIGGVLNNPPPRPDFPPESFSDFFQLFLAVLWHGLVLVLVGLLFFSAHLVFRYFYPKTSGNARGNSAEVTDHSSAKLNALFLLGVVVVNVVVWFFITPRKPALDYIKGIQVSAYAGNGEYGSDDGRYDRCSMISPGDMSWEGNDLYFIDNGRLRVLRDKQMVTTLEGLPYIAEYNVERVQVWRGDLFILTGPWQDRLTEDGDGNDGAETYRVSLMRLPGGDPEKAETIFDPEAPELSPISDFAVQDDGIYFIRLPAEGGNPRLEMIPYDEAAHAYNRENWRVVLGFRDYEKMEMTQSRLAFDLSGNLYISVPGFADGRIEQLSGGEILRISREELSKERSEYARFIGQIGTTARNDRKESVSFRYPTAIAVNDAYLYVYDWGVIRQIAIENGAAGRCRTLAGIPPETVSKEDREDEPGQNLYGKDAVKWEGNNFYFSPDTDSALALDDMGQALVSYPFARLICRVAPDSK